MKVSIVTISFNQAHYLETAIQSVIDQDHPDIEYIVVDPGSTDGSRDIIDRYRNRISKVIFEPDFGPADGLNKGFSNATGEIFGFINSDDYFLPGALRTVVAKFSRNANLDVLSGNCLIVDKNGHTKNYFRSRRYSPNRYVYGAATLAQQSTFFRADAFRKSGGFNPENRIAWDGELWVDLGLSGARFGRLNTYLSAFRVYDESISGGGGHRTKAYRDYSERMWLKVKNRPKNAADNLTRVFFKAMEYGLDPALLANRLIRGPVLPT
ncbi:MAG: glycosyltransferase family 2 protein [Pseudomonadota bacterium]